MEENTRKALFEYCLRLGDDSLILGHRLSEWCGHGPVLEQDIALTNFALDLIGQAKILLSYAGELEGKGRTEDDLAYRRGERAFRNHKLVEQPNGHFGTTILRQYFFDLYQYHLNQALMESADSTLAAYAAKSIKEVAYHKRFSEDWLIRLGDGTEESHKKMKAALDELWTFTGELFEVHPCDEILHTAKIAPNPKEIGEKWKQDIIALLEKATLKVPDFNIYMATGSQAGIHTEHLGFILTEMQYLPRTYPDAVW